MFDALVSRIQRAIFGEPEPQGFDYRPAPGLPHITITKIKKKDDDELSPTPLCIIR